MSSQVDSKPPWVYINDWLVGQGHPSEKYERQMGWLFPIYGKIKNVEASNQVRKIIPTIDRCPFKKNVEGVPWAGIPNPRLEDHTSLVTLKKLFHDYVHMFVSPVLLYIYIYVYNIYIYIDIHRGSPKRCRTVFPGCSFDNTSPIISRFQTVLSIWEVSKIVKTV